MMKLHTNGNGNLKKLSEIKQEPIVYPVTYDLKAVMEGASEIEKSQNKISEILKKII